MTLVLYVPVHLQCQLDSIRKSSATRIGASHTFDPSERRQLPHYLTGPLIVFTIQRGDVKQFSASSTAVGDRVLSLDDAGER